MIHVVSTATPLFFRLRHLVFGATIATASIGASSATSHAHTPVMAQPQTVISVTLTPAAPSPIPMPYPLTDPSSEDEKPG